MNKEEVINILTEELGLVNYVKVTRYLANLDTEIIMLQKENKQLKENRNKLKKWLDKIVKLTENIDEKMTCKNVLEKIQELEKGEDK